MKVTRHLFGHFLIPDLILERKKDLQCDSMENICYLFRYGGSDFRKGCDEMAVFYDSVDHWLRATGIVVPLM